ncbi:MAG: TA system VapC family ribonuclease toxin [bacterium]
MIALDTNLLVYAHRSGVPEHRAAKRAIQRAAAAPGGAGISAPCLAEFWAVVTHPTAAGRPSTPAEAAGFLQSLIETARLAVWLPSPGFERRLTEAARTLSISGPRIFDLQIALIAFEHGAKEIWTHDAGFLTVAGLRRGDPLSTAAPRRSIDRCPTRRPARRP